MLKQIDNANQFLKGLRQQYWTGQAYDLMHDELSSILLVKWYAEKNDLDFSTSTFNELFTTAQKFFNIDLKVGPVDSRLHSVVRTLSEYKIRGNAEISHQMHQAWLKKTHRKDLGQYFTPPFIRRFMMEIYKPSHTDVVCDPAAGSGAFLIEAANAMSHFRPSNFMYFDIDRLGAVPTAEKAFLMYEHPKTGASLDGVTMKQCDSLAEQWSTSPDRIYTNVPFGLNITNREILNKFEVSAGKKSQISQLLFIEKCLRELKEGGTFATVVDRGVASNLGLRKERSILSRMAHLELVVELPGVAFEYFAGTTFGTFLLFFTKTRSLERKRTMFTKVSNIGYDGKGYSHNNDVSMPRSFDPVNMQSSWENSDFRVAVDHFRDDKLDSVCSTEVAETGDWLYGSYKFRGTAGDRLKDLAVLSNIQWDGSNILNPTVNRKYRMVEETHLNPSKKSNSLVLHSILFSRLLSETQEPACGVVDSRFQGAGVTSENYVIVPKNGVAMTRIWHAINFNKEAGEYLRAISRGQGRGRIKEEDLMNLPIPPVQSHDKIASIIDLVHTKAETDQRLSQKLETLNN